MNPSHRILPRIFRMAEGGGDGGGATPGSAAALLTPPAAPAPGPSPAPAGGAPSPSPAPAAPSPAPAPSPMPLPPAGTTNANDYKWAGDEAAQAVAKAKGWASPADAIRSYDDLQKLLGTEKVPIPKNDNDIEGWNRFYAAAGRPNTPGEYNLPVAEGGSKESVEAFGKTAHELGLSQKQAAGLAKWYDEQMGGQITQTKTETEQRVSTEIAQVADDWGHNYNQNAEIARRGAMALGLDKEALDVLEESPKFGHKKLMGMLLKYGQAGGEAKFHDGGGGQSFAPQTKETAQARIKEIQADATLRSEALKPGSKTNLEFERLNKIIAGERV